MAIQVNPITQSLPATTAIQDPAVRRFAQAVEDALRALRSEEGAVESLKKAADAMKKAADAMNNAVAGGTPPSIAQWLFSSELYQKLTSEIARVDVEAKQNVLDEALARQTAIDEINATLATIQSTAAYDPLVTYAIGNMVTYDGKLYQAILATTGNLPTNTTYWKKVGDYATLGDVVAAHTLEIDNLESRVTTDEGNLTAEIADRQALATQVRGTYTGTNVDLVTQGLMYSERVARSTADSAEVAARQSLSAKLTGSNDPSGLTIETLASGLIFDEKQARVSGDDANASSISALRAQVGVTEAGALTTGLILDEKNVRASNDLAIVSAVNTALAQITGVSTSISQSGENLIANWTTAQADKWSQIEAEVLTSGGQTIRAALLQESQTRANADGSLGAQWTLKTDIDGYISGFGFASTANNATPTSEFIIRADKFAVVMPGYGEHVPFAIGPSGAEFTGLTSWGKVTGAGKPENGATVGADSSNLRAGPGVNMVFNGDYTDGLAGTTVGWRSAGNQHTLSRNLSGYIVQGEGTAYIMQPGSNGTALFEAYIWNGQEGQHFAVTPGHRYEVYAYLNTHRCVGRVFVLFHDAAGNQLTIFTGSEVSYAGDINTISDMRISHGFVVAPWNAAKALVIVRGEGINSVDPYVFFSRVYFGMAHAGQTEASPWSPGRGISQITSSNVTTYIDYAALGNAQIGGNLWSTNWNYAGGTGWLLDRSGNFYGNNIYARGDIEASSLKANTAMVQTLNINGNAVTVPVTYTSTATTALAYNTWTTVGSAYINPEGAVVFVHAFAQFSNNDSNSDPMFLRVVSPSGAVIAAAGPTVTSTMNWGAGTATRSGSVTLSGAFSEAGTYTLQMHPGANTNYSAHHRALLLLAGKR